MISISNVRLRPRDYCHPTRNTLNCLKWFILKGENIDRSSASGRYVVTLLLFGGGGGGGSKLLHFEAAAAQQKCNHISGRCTTSINIFTFWDKWFLAVQSVLRWMVAILCSKLQVRHRNYPTEWNYYILGRRLNNKSVTTYRADALLRSIFSPFQINDFRQFKVFCVGWP